MFIALHGRNPMECPCGKIGSVSMGGGEQAGPILTVFCGEDYNTPTPP